MWAYSQSITRIAPLESSITLPVWNSPWTSVKGAGGGLWASSQAAIHLTKQYLRDAFRAQLEGRGFSLVEILTMCPTDWFVAPEEGPAFVERRLLPTYPLGVVKPG